MPGELAEHLDQLRAWRAARQAAISLAGVPSLVTSPLNSFSATVRVEPSGWRQPAMDDPGTFADQPSRLSSLQSNAAMPLSASAGRRHNGLPA